MTERATSWLRVIVAAAAIAIPAIYGYGALSNRVTDVKAVQLRVLDEKADKTTVNVQYDAILRELQSIGQRLGRLEARR